MRAVKNSFVGVVLALNLVAVTVAALLPNGFLVLNSGWFFGFQLVTLIPYLCKMTNFARDFFLPSFFALAYSTISLTLGSILLPRGYGTFKRFSEGVLAVTEYRTIIPFLLLSNLALFVLGYIQLRKLAAIEKGKQNSRSVAEARAGLRDYLAVPLFLALFGTVAYFDIYNAFSFQFAFLLIHFGSLARRKIWYRWFIYLLYLGLLVQFDHDNKREIIIVMFLVAFLEANYRRWALKFSLRSFLMYGLAWTGFMGLVLSASILRGYGSFGATSFFDAISYLPQYIKSDSFGDNVTENLELNSSYGAAVISMDMVLHHKIAYQYGKTLTKVLYLPIPRSQFPSKPDSMMTLFTEAFAPDWVEIGGSMPVMFCSDMFGNFHIFGLIPFALVWLVIDYTFLRFQVSRPGSFDYHSCAFLFLFVLLLVRGSGFEQYLLYYLIAIPVLLVPELFRGRRRIAVKDPFGSAETRLPVT